jgi:hypothetical protein
VFPTLGISVLLLFPSSESGAAAPSPPLVWIAHSTATVLPATKPGAGREIELCAARGEFESAQVVLTPSVDAADVRVSVTELAGPRGARLGGGDITLRRVLLVEGQPDVLAPLAPLNLKAGQNQAVWLTVHAPQDATPGLYRGEVVVAGAGAPQRVPVRLTVWRFALPVTPSIPAVFGIADRMFSHCYGLKEGTPEWERALHVWYQFLVPYRLSPYFCKFQQKVPEHYSYPAPWPIGDSRTDAVLADPRLAAFAIPYPLGGDRERLRRTLEHLRAKGWLNRGYFYLSDEPGTMAQYAKVREWAGEIHAIAPEARVLTTYYCGPLDGPRKGESEALPDILGTATQIYCMSEWATGANEEYRRRIEGKLRLGDEFWLYVCCGPGDPHPNLFLKMTGVQHRAVMWRIWKERATGFLYWAVNAFADAANNPAAPIRFGSGGLPLGDGALVYRGEPFGAASPLASVRLERWRDGMEDCELLLAYAQRLGRPAALALLAQVYQSPIAYTHDGQQLERWRQTLAENLNRPQGWRRFFWQADVGDNQKGEHEK